ncbi:ATP-dependent dethiobiotin synthetase BioD 1 [Pragia fontium]|uniref:dethiobiotin synthase n=1 Tax=Pragia fontium TaxID=82985 RepID=UPI00064AAA99|nr:dethiobiotin synthase [Pragia fontium]AKJ42783.1 dethiobiotin synthetase [Pragia fontium]SUB83161.1 ATP-dependent dethiobiotin synthetase BioD 1 [Pragia fontium]
MNDTPANQPALAKVWFVTGTDTDVGKTVASCALLQAFSSASYRVAGYKPIASGSQITSSGLRNSDALALQRYSSVSLTYPEVNPLTLLEPTSPHIASRLEQRPIVVEQLSAGLTHLKQKADIVVVEGAGGWFTPLSDRQNLSDWVTQQQISVILVVGMKLGCINHALLTQQALLSAGVHFSGWIANNIQAPNKHYSAYLETLKQRLTAPMIGEIPYLTEPEEHSALQQYVDISTLA